MAAVADIRGELVSGDAAKQTGALMTISGILASGRDAAPYVSLAIHAVLSSPTAPPLPRRVAYDLALACPGLTDADWARVAAAVGQDLQRGSPHQVRVKALEALPQLPGHRLAALLADPQLVLARVLASLLSPTDAVRAAAAGAVAGLAERPEVAASAAGQAALLSALMDLWEAVPDALTGEGALGGGVGGRVQGQLLTAPPSPLPRKKRGQPATNRSGLKRWDDGRQGRTLPLWLVTQQSLWLAPLRRSLELHASFTLQCCVPAADETDVVVAAASAAVTTLLTRTTASRPPGHAAPPPPLPTAGAALEDALTPEGERATAAGVQHSLHAAVQTRVGAVLGAALARFATLGSMALVSVPPLVVAYLRSLAPAPLGEGGGDGDEEYSRAALSLLPGEVPPADAAGALAGADRGHAVEECTAFLVELLHCVSSAASMAAAEALLELAQVRLCGPRM